MLGEKSVGKNCCSVNNGLVGDYDKCGLFSDIFINAQVFSQSSCSITDLLTFVSDGNAGAFNRSGAALLQFNDLNHDVVCNLAIYADDATFYMTKL